MRKLARLTVVAVVSFGLFATLGSSTAFAGVGGGTVAGTVTTDGIGGCPAGNPLCVKQQKHIVFGSVIISGAFTSDDFTHQFVGTVNVGSTGSVTAYSSAGSTIATDAGVVNPFTVNETVGAPGTIKSGLCSGSYQRVGSIVIVPLNCRLGIDVPAPQVNAKLTVNVVAQFTPTSGDGVLNPITAANFSGIYVGTPA